MKASKIIVLIVSLLLLGCQNNTSKKQKVRPQKNASAYEPQSYVKLKHPEWSKNGAIYELNTRQFTEEGTFKAAQKQLSRLKDLGVSIVWLMPINEIGVKNRKGTLGSPYSVKDYKKVNPEFGTMQDLKDFVNKAHQLGMHVIIDWVANHTAWDNWMVTKHPDWYDRDYKGDFRPTPWWDWSDIIDLDYSKPALREYMTGAMKFWVEEADIDGFRCDVAGFVPIDFWENVRAELEKVKPVFMLAEWESRDLHAKAFDMTYAWTWYDRTKAICEGHANVNSLYEYYSWNESAFPENSLRMTFVTNHDKNSWEGTMFEVYGKGLKASIVLSVIGEGMPLIYNGQEAGNTKRLAFFEKDPIQWKESEYGKLYKDLLTLEKKNTALWHAAWGARMVKVPNNNESEILSFVRQNDKDKVFAVFNFSNKKQTITFKEKLYYGTYSTFGSNEKATFDSNSKLIIEPWGYRVYVK